MPKFSKYEMIEKEKETERKERQKKHVAIYCEIGTLNVEKENFLKN